MPDFPTSNNASGIWSIKEQRVARAGENWPNSFPTGLIAGTSSLNTGTASFTNGPGYYGVETSAAYTLTGGRRINQFKWRETNTATNTSTWFLVLEGSPTAQRYYLIAGWRILSSAATNDLIQTADAQSAFLTLGNVDAVTKSYIVPTSATYGTGVYYIGWVSGDPRGRTAKNGQMYASMGAAGSTIDYELATNIGYPDENGVGAHLLIDEGVNWGAGINVGFFNV